MAVKRKNPLDLLVFGQVTGQERAGIDKNQVLSP